MKDSRFTELLNLYLDHHISSDEAAELESEVTRYPARRHTYDQYCRLQRACSLLGERERSTAPASAAFARSLRDAERKIAAARRTAWWSSPAYAGVFVASAMAACVAVVFVVGNRAPSPTAMNIATKEMNPVSQAPVISKSEATPVVMVATTPQAGMRSMPVSTFDVQPILAASGFGVARNAREAEIAANDREVREWMQRVEQSGVAAILVDDHAFEARATLHQDNRVFRSRHGIQGNAEFTAFQFQR